MDLFVDCSLPGRGRGTSQRSICTLARTGMLDDYRSIVRWPGQGVIQILLDMKLKNRCGLTV